VKKTVSPGQRERNTADSYRVVWKQNESLFIAGKAKDRILNNTKMMLRNLNYQPQKSCTFYTKIQDRVARIDQERKNKVSKFLQKAKKGKGIDNRKISMISETSETTSAA